MIKLKDVIEKYGDQYIDEEKLKEVIVKPKGRRKPWCNEWYWFIDIDNNKVECDVWNNSEVDNRRYNAHNCFTTMEECGIAKEIQDYCIENSFEPNWKDEEQEKWHICIDYTGELVLNNKYFYDIGAKYYFPTKEVVRRLINTFKKEDLIKHYFHVYD